MFKGQFWGHRFNRRDKVMHWQWRIQGGGGVTGVITPPSPWTCPDPKNLCKVCVTGTDHPPPPWNVDDVTRAMTWGGGACEYPSGDVNFSEGGWRHAGNVQGGGVLVNVLNAERQRVMTSRGQCPHQCRLAHVPHPVYRFPNSLLYTFPCYDEWRALQTVTPLLSPEAKK